MGYEVEKEEVEQWFLRLPQQGQKWELLHKKLSFSNQWHDDQKEIPKW